MNFKGFGVVVSFSCWVENLNFGVSGIAMESLLVCLGGFGNVGFRFSRIVSGKKYKEDIFKFLKWLSYRERIKIGEVFGRRGGVYCIIIFF